MPQTQREPIALTATKAVARHLGVRLDDASARALIRYCARHSINQSEGVRRLILAGKNTPEKTLDEVAKILGFDPKSATVAELVAELQRLSAEAGLPDAAPPAAEPVANPTTEPAEVPPPKTLSALISARAADRDRLKQMRQRERSRGKGRNPK